MPIISKAIVTGGAGYLGSRLVEALELQGCKVFVIDQNINDNQNSENTFFIQANMSNMLEVMHDIEAVDVIFNCAASVPLVKDKQVIRQSSEGSLMAVLDFASKNEIPKVVHMSSSAVYGRVDHLPVTKTTPMIPIEEYGKAKYVAEQICNSFRKKGLDISIIRPRTIVGLGRLGIFSLLFNWIQRDIDIPFFGELDLRYQMVHIDDLVTAVIESAKIVGPNDYNLGAKVFESRYTELNSLIQIAGSGSRIMRLPNMVLRTATAIPLLLQLLPFAEYQLRLYSESFYFDDHDWKILGVEPKYSNLDSLISSYEYFVSENNSSRSIFSSPHKKNLSGLAVNILTESLRGFTKLRKLASSIRG